MKGIKHVITDLNDLNSIKRSERQKAKLENDGWVLIRQECDQILGMSKLTYTK